MFWTEKQIKQLRELYAKHSAPICAKLMNLTPSQVKGATRRYNILSGRDGKIKKGNRPWNAGKKGIHIGGIETQFKPGNEPHNTRHNGAISIRRDKSGNFYQFIRINKARWEPLHKFNYTMYVGPIKPGNIVVFKDRNTMNPAPENLIQITRAEHCRRNANKTKAAETLRKLYSRERIRKQYGLAPISKLAMRLTNY
jgi:hypothetical protein